MNKKRSAEQVTAIIDETLTTDTELVTDIRVEPQPSIENPTYLDDTVILYSELGADRYVVTTISNGGTLISIESELSVAIDKAVNLCRENILTRVTGITTSNEVKKIIKYVYDSNTGHVLKYNKDNYIPTNKAYVYEVIDAAH